MRTTLRLAICAALLTIGPAAIDAQETPSDTLLTVQHYLDFEQVADPQLSPDGSTIVFTRRWVNKLEDRFDAALWIMDADGSRQRFLIEGSSPRWSPDGTRIAYIAPVEGKPQIHVRWMDAEGAVSQVTRLQEAPSNLKWSPDGRWLSFSMNVPYEKGWSISMPSAPRGANWTPAPRHVTELHYRQDRAGFMRPVRTHLFVVPAEGGTERAVTSGEYNVGARFDQLAGGVGYDWTPDSRSIVFDGYLGDDADYNYRDSDIHIVDIASGDIRKLTQRAGNWTNPVVSPDGRTIAFTGHEKNRMSYKTGELFFMGIDGGDMRLGSGDLDRDVGGIIWAADNSGVHFTSQNEGTSNLYFAPVRGGVRQVTTGTHMLGISSIARNGLAVGVRSAPQEPGDIVGVALNRPADVQRLTAVNEDVLANIRLGEVEEVWYTSTGGTRVQGWIVKPPDFDPSNRYPLIMEIHGGPHGMYNVGFSYMYQNFAANGYVVLYTNPRGSTGYGTDFGNAIERAYPSVDYDDLMAGVDTVVGRGYIDETRMYVGGCSGGGVLSSWVIGHTDRFAAAAVRCPVSNWLSFAGHADVPLFTYNFFDRPFWEDPEPWLRHSPLMYVGNVTTPTLLMTGQLDLRTPMSQTEEYYAALKMRRVPAELLQFEGEYHGTGSKPSNFMRTQLYMMSWYQRWDRKDATTDR